MFFKKGSVALALAHEQLQFAQILEIGLHGQQGQVGKPVFAVARPPASTGALGGLNLVS
jgi:hypothetical protein